MSWTFTNNPSGVPRDAVRILCGDTNENEPLLSDETIAWLLSEENGSTILAAARACELIASQFAREADISVGELSVKFSTLAENYRQRALSLRAEASLLANSPLPASARKTERDPIFYLGRFDYD